jgi:hypothetical protein
MVGGGSEKIPTKGDIHQRYFILQNGDSSYWNGNLGGNK